MSSVCFTHPLYPTLLIEQKGEKSLIYRDMPRESSIFNTLDEFIRSEGFDYFFYNDILKISDIGLSKNEITLILELQLEGMKDI